MKLLVVEDERRLAQIVAGGLAEAGYVVDVAFDGVEGQAFFEKNSARHAPDWVRRVTVPSPGSSKNREVLEMAGSEACMTAVTSGMGIALMPYHAVVSREVSRRVAVLNVESDVRRDFNRSQVMTLETLADGIGIILRNAELYQAVERTNARLVELDRMKSELVNIVAHDFRSPLAGVLGHAELLEWRPDAPRSERLDQARAIIQAATHMANLVEKTLKTNRMETGQFPFEFGIIDLAAIAREVVGRIATKPTHPLTCEIPEDPVPCWADRDRVAEVLENLISNAVKYSPAGGRVHVEVRREDERALVSVRDEGIGIAEGDLDRLFRPFSRVRNLRTADIEGSGLGLYICDRIVRAHGGRLRVETAPEKGSVFSFAVPLFGAAAQTRPPMILVAAADEQTRREVRRLADEQGYAVHEVMDGVEAVESALRLVPAAVVLDRVLPRLRAEEVADRLRANPATQRVLLFVLAGEADLADQARMFDGFIPKPLSKSTLAAAIGSLDRTAPP